MKKFFLTLDLEDWWHLEYLKKYRHAINSRQCYINQVLPFLDAMKDKGIPVTVFVVAEIAENFKEIIKTIAEMGHELACHSYRHTLLYELSNNEFEYETVKAKHILEDICGREVIGYRAPCFSMDIEKLDILWKNGFLYDASYIRFKGHQYYTVMDLSKYEKIDSLVYSDKGRYVFEIPTYNILGKAVPISGGGYFRLFPKPVFKHILNDYYRNEPNFIFYIHPFELTNAPLENIRCSGAKNYFRFEAGRRNNYGHLLDLLESLKNDGTEFLSFEKYIAIKAAA